MKYQGVWVALATPFTESGALDDAAFEKLLEHVADAGVQGLVPCGTTGESPTLTADERRRIVETTVRFAKQRGLGVLAGCGGNDTAVTIANVKEAAKLGAQGALVVTPYYNKPTAEGLFRHYSKVADGGGLPVVLYNVPGRTGVNLAPETVARLFENDSIVGIKEASGQYGQWLAIAQATDLSRKSLLAGDDDSFAPVLALGGSGIISASANVAPAAFVALYKAHAAGHSAAVWSWQKKLYPLVKALFSESNPGPVKHALSRLGIARDVLRLPLVSVGEGSRKLIDSALRGLELVG